jgi:hypothetical protein
MLKDTMKFILLLLSLQVLSTQLFANDEAQLQQTLDGEIVEAQKRYNINPAVIPNFKGNDWKVHVIAEEDAYSEVIEIQGNSIVHVGQSLVADRIIIHGDGVVWVKGLLNCPIIDIRGKGLIMFDTNSVNFNGGWIKLDTGVILSNGKNKMNVHLRNGGFFKSGGDNHGEVMVSDGELKLDVQGDQMGDINVLSPGGKANLKISGDLGGAFSSKGPISLQVGGDIQKSLIGESDVTLKAGKILGQQLSALGHLDADVHQLGERIQPISVQAKTAKIKSAKGRFGDISLVGKGELFLGGASIGSISSIQGDLLIKISKRHEGNISSGGALNFEANSSTGDMVAAKALKVVVKESLTSHRLVSGENGNISSSIFKGNIDIKKHAILMFGETLRGSFATQISIGSGKVNIKGSHHLDTLSKGSLELNAKNGSGFIKAGGLAKIYFAGDHLGKIQAKGPLDLQVGGKQLGYVHAGSSANAKFATLASGLTVLGKAQLEIGRFEIIEYEDTNLRIGAGTLSILSDALFDIEGLASGQWLKVAIKGDRPSKASSKGHLELNITGDSSGDIETLGQLHLKAQNHEGLVNVSENCNIEVKGQWKGHLASHAKGGSSSFFAATVFDSNFLFNGGLSLKANKILNRIPGEEQIRIETGSVIVKDEIESNLMAVGKVTVKAKRIVGDVFVDKASRIDSIVRGRLKTRMN